MKTKKLTVMALTTALAMILSFVESQIPAFVAVPGVKMGLANIAVVFALYKLGCRCGCQGGELCGLSVELYYHGRWRSVWCREN